MANPSSEESTMRGVLARAFLNILRNSAGGVAVGVVLESASDARPAIRHLESLAVPLGVVPTRVRRTNGDEEFELEPGRRIVFFNRRTGANAVRGWSLDVIYAPGDWMTPERGESVYPALCARAGEIEIY